MHWHAPSAVVFPTVAPGSGEAPNGHGVQVVAPISEENVPTGHGIHLLDAPNNDSGVI